MTWEIEISGSVQLLIDSLEEHEAKRVIAAVQILQKHGPTLGRPYVDTLKGSRHKNMKELRIRHDQKCFRIFFAFDPKRTAILLTGGDKVEYGVDRFYEDHISEADNLFDQHLNLLKKKANDEVAKKAKKARSKTK